MPPGSFVVISHAGSDLLAQESAAFEKNLNEQLPGEWHVARPRPDVARFFAGPALLEPGVVRVSEWWPAAVQPAAHTTLWGNTA